jgi:alpha-L-rhamnosidase
MYFTRISSIHLLIFFLSCLLNQSFSQDIPDHILTKRWKSFWIEAPSSAPGTQFSVVTFRKVFELTKLPQRFVVHVSADTHYKLYVNGVLASIGPARSDQHYWNFETADIAPYLKTGENVIASIVWNLGEHRPIYQFSHRTAFIIQGNSPEEELINSNTTWKCFANKAYSPLQPELPNVYYAAGAGERVNYNLYPENWNQFSFDDKEWAAAKEINNGIPKGVFDYSIDWMLVPRLIPPMEMSPQRFRSIRESTIEKMSEGLLCGKGPVSIKPNSKHTILLDHGHLTNAYPVVKFRNGKNAKVKLTYAEALYIDEGSKKPWKDQVQKGNRNEIEGKRVAGVSDEFIADGKDHTFIPLNWHTFRYIQVEVETKDEALIFEELSSIFTAYPFQLKSVFASDQPELKNILDVGWRTARLCAEESYMDTPYYERLQYFGDTRIQALITLYNTTDDRLVKRAILMGDISRLPEGLTLSRYPSAHEQIIPPFSLHWIGMLRDYYLYGKDRGFIKDFLMGQRHILSFFRKYQGEDRSLKNPPYWQFTDWAETNGWSFGVPPTGSDGCSAALDFQLLAAYQHAAFLEDEIGMKEFSAMYRDEAARLTEGIKAKYWDDGKELFADTKEKNVFSQHTNALAILTNTVNADKVRTLGEKVLKDTTLTQATIYFKYYVNQALANAGLGSEYLHLLGDWRTSLAEGLTTWPEISDINNTRSDCHAWSSSPNIELYRIVLGIDSEGQGFTKIKIEPNLGKLKKASGSIPHPLGEIKVDYKVGNDGTLEATIYIPAGTSGRLLWHGKSHILKTGLNTFTKL